MRPKYIEFIGNHPAEKEEDRQYFDSPQQTWSSYGAVYGKEYLKVEITDYNKTTGEPIEPIRGKAQSDVVIAILDLLKIKYNGIKTENGKQLFFRKPGKLAQTNKLNWYSTLRIRADWRFPESGDVIPLMINGIERRFFKGNIEDTEIDELPSFLYPLQKSKAKPLDLEFRNGNIRNRLLSYLFALVKRGFVPEQAFLMVRLLNNYILDMPMTEKMLEREVLNEEILQKLRDINSAATKKEVSPETFRNFILETGMFITYNELLNIIEFHNLPDDPSFQNIKDYQNQMPTMLQYAFRRYTGAKNISKQQTIDLISLEADRNSYHPIRDYLRRTTWDGIDRFPELFKVLGVKDELEQILVRKWFYQSAALPFNTLERPIQPEGVLILQGSEGIGKTRFFRRMSVESLWFTSLDKPMTTKNKDTLIEALSSWITEIGEIDQTFTERRSDLKSFMTAEKDTIRKPYAREPTTRARTTSICGTTNKVEFLNGETGYRRWWVIHISGKIDLDSFATEKTLSQFWAQCYAANIRDPCCFRLTDSERKQLEALNQSVMEMLPAEDELRMHFDFNAPETEWHWVQTAELKKYTEYDVSQYSSITIGRALMKISEEYPIIQRRKYGGNYLWFIPPIK